MFEVLYSGCISWGGGKVGKLIGKEIPLLVSTWRWKKFCTAGNRTAVMQLLSSHFTDRATRCPSEIEIGRVWMKEKKYTQNSGWKASWKGTNWKTI